ncbi:MAG TPA: hypothetical protein VED83_04350 [Burkholderiaceae bacterium]|nr:hypothetical protein [Burkholderiaceae bacterium]
MTNTIRIGLATLALGVACASAAAEFDGSKAIICAPTEAMDCSPGAVCARGMPDEIGAPAFIRIDFSKKVVIGPKRSTPIIAIEKNDAQILLLGSELGFAWSIAIDQQDGRMSATLTDHEGAYVLFGPCTAL